MSWYTKKKDVMRVCRYCGKFFCVERLRHSQSVCDDPACQKMEYRRIKEKRRIYLKRRYDAMPHMRGGTKKARRRLNVKIRKKCLQCGRTYWDYGDCHFGRCPACKQLDWYGEDDYGYAVVGRE